MKDKGQPEEVKTVRKRVKLLKATQYKGCMVYIKMFDNEIFTYDLIFENQLYFSYIVMKPRTGQKVLSKKEIAQTAAMIFAGATTTIDMKLGVKLDAQAKKRAELVIEASKRLVN